MADGGNTFQEATRLGILRFASRSSSVDAFGNLEPGETVDWYQVKAKGRASNALGKTLSVSSTGTPLNSTVDIYFRAAGLPPGRGKRVATFTGGSSDSLDLKVRPGTYFFKVSALPGGVPVGSSNSFYVSMISVNVGNFKTAATNREVARSTSGKNLFR
jgi:hypothetical protein